MNLKSRMLVICSIAALCFGATAVPAAAENASAHRLTKTMRHHRPMMMRHHHNMMMHRDMR